jgi:DNA-binding NtrC family response regulator
MARVLVVDDEDTILAAIKRRLERACHEVETAETSPEGISKINSAAVPYDVIITDMSMENQESGLQLLHAAFARDLFAAVIVMTAYGNVANAVECMRRGAFDYIEKNSPQVDVYEMLAHKIDEAMDRRRRDVRTIDLWERGKEAKL